MVSQIRKGARRRIYLREWRERLQETNPAISAQRMADRLEIERESYYRLERKPWMLNGAEIIELEEAMGLDPGQLLQPPPQPDAPPSLDQIARGASREQFEMVVDVVKRIMGKGG